MPLNIILLTRQYYIENINNDNVIFKYIEYDSVRYLLHPDISQNLDKSNISKYLHEFFI
jgi:hypothetical protein